MKRKWQSTLELVRSLRFASPPEAGFQLEVGRARQVFTVEGLQPYTRKDGSQTHLIVWSSPCSEPGCDDVFHVASCLTSINNQFGNRRCEQHRQPRKRVKINRS